MIIFLPINLDICFRCSKELSHREGSFEYPQHMFWLRNKKNNFLVRTLICRPGLIREDRKTSQMTEQLLTYLTQINKTCTSVRRSSNVGHPSFNFTLKFLQTLTYKFKPTKTSKMNLIYWKTWLSATGAGLPYMLA